MSLPDQTGGGPVSEGDEQRPHVCTADFEGDCDVCGRPVPGAGPCEDDLLNALGSMPWVGDH